MKVATNTSSINANRQNKIINKKTDKNLEKLSSGYKINKAADDASGLAISEKMKAQITALEQAGFNCEDGISLIQTADAYLNELHGMLQRMVELSMKSANGILDGELQEVYPDHSHNTTPRNTADPEYASYDNSNNGLRVDRVSLESEFAQLRKEFDRIANTANFNNIKLFNGSLALYVDNPMGKVSNGIWSYIPNAAASPIPQNTSLTATVPAGNIVISGNLNITSTYGPYINRHYNSATGNLDSGYVDITRNILTSNVGETTANINTTGSVVVDLNRNGRQIVANTVDVGINDNATIVVENGGKITENYGPQAQVWLKGGTTYMEINSEGQSGHSGPGKVFVKQPAELFLETNCGYLYNEGTATITDNLQYLGSKTCSPSTHAGNFGVYNFTGAKMTITGVNETRVDNFGDLTVGVNANNGSYRTGSIYNNSGTLKVNINEAAIYSWSKVDIDDNKGDVISYGDDLTITNNYGKSTVKVYGTNSSITNLSDGHIYNYSQDFKVDTMTGGIIDNFGIIDVNSASGGTIRHHVTDVDTTNALDLQNPSIDITFNGQTYTVAGELVPSFTDDCGDNNPGIKFDFTNFLIQNNLIGPNEEVVFDGTDASGADLKNWFNINGVTFTFLDANDSPTDDITKMRSVVYAPYNKKTSPLVLQVGETSRQSDKLVVDIGSFYCKDLGLKDVNILSQDGANESIFVTRNAINIVSAQRASLGSLQNRLEHTINYLGTGMENIAQANSRIRDTDIAKEMTEYTKNNTLMQASQSMLAQANSNLSAALELLK